MRVRRAPASGSLALAATEGDRDRPAGDLDDVPRRGARLVPDPRPGRLARRRRPGVADDEFVAFQKAWFQELRGAGYAVPALAGGVGRRHVDRRAGRALPGAGGARRAPAGAGVRLDPPRRVDAARTPAPTSSAQRHLPAILDGEIWCQGFSEPDAGSDLASLRDHAPGGTATASWSTARRSGPAAPPHADWCLLLARTDPDAPKRHGISYFLLDMRSPGIDVRPIRQATGESHFCEMFLDDVVIPGRNLVGRRERRLAGGPGDAQRRAGHDDARAGRAARQRRVPLAGRGVRAARPRRRRVRSTTRVVAGPAGRVRDRGRPACGRCAATSSSAHDAGHGRSGRRLDREAVLQRAAAADDRLRRRDRRARRPHRAAEAACRAGGSRARGCSTSSARGSGRSPAARARSSARSSASAASACPGNRSAADDDRLRRPPRRAAGRGPRPARPTVARRRRASTGAARRRRAGSASRCPRRSTAPARPSPRSAVVLEEMGRAATTGAVPRHRRCSASARSAWSRRPPARRRCSAGSPRGRSASRSPRADGGGRLPSADAAVPRSHRSADGVRLDGRADVRARRRRRRPAAARWRGDPDGGAAWSSSSTPAPPGCRSSRSRCSTPPGASAPCVADGGVGRPTARSGASRGDPAAPRQRCSTGRAVAVACDSLGLGAGDARRHGRLRRRSATSSAGRSARSRRSSTPAPTCSCRSRWSRAARRAGRRRPSPTAIRTPRSRRPDGQVATSARAAVDVVGKAMQLHGGIGYTWESGIHVYLKRAVLNRSLFGSPLAHRRLPGRDLGPSRWPRGRRGLDCR